MRFSPFAFIGGQSITANFYYDVDNYDSYVTGSTLWYNIGVSKSTGNSDLVVSASWYKTDSTGSYMEIPEDTNVLFNPNGIGSQPTQTTYIYELDITSGFNTQRFLGRTDPGNTYYCGMNSGKFSATQTSTIYTSDLSVSSDMQNQFFYLAVQNYWTGGGYGTTTYFTSFDNFTTGYSVNFSPGHGVAFAFDYLTFICRGIGKVKTIGVYYDILSTAKMQAYSQTGPFV